MEQNELLKLQSSNYRHVALTDSLWKQQFEETMELYLNLSNDSLLHIFRSRAGLAAPGQSLTGWYGHGASTFGQKLAAFSKAYLVTSDERFKDKALFLAEEWFACADANPAVLKYDSYAYDKMMGGLLDVYEYLGCAKALEYVGKITDSAMATFKRDIPREGIQNESLWRNNIIEWYTLPEHLLRAYEFTGEEKYREFASEWDYHFMWEHALKKDFWIGSRHAYSHINALSSAARQYWVSKDPSYLQAIINIYDEVTTHQAYATGGYGPAEGLYVAKKSYLGDAIKPTWDAKLNDPAYISFDGNPKTRDDRWGNCEVSCCAWAVFKACNYLMLFTGEARFGDWVEKMLYNGTGGQLPITPDGKVMYYANYWLDGAFKTTEDRRLFDNGSNFHWQCCTGTFPQDVVEYHNLLYYFDDRGILVSQYLPSTVDFTVHETKVTLENTSAYPQESTVRLTVSAEKDVRFHFRFRVPSWAVSGVVVKVNGKTLDMEARPNSWGEIDRVWSNADEVSLEFPFELYFSSVDSASPEIMALHCGPLVLVADEMTLFYGDALHPEHWIHPVEGALWTFETEPGHVGGYDFLTRRFVPYYTVGEMAWYYMYNRVCPSASQKEKN